MWEILLKEYPKPFAFEGSLIATLLIWIIKSFASLIRNFYCGRRHLQNVVWKKVFSWTIKYESHKHMSWLDVTQNFYFSKKLANYKWTDIEYGFDKGYLSVNKLSTANGLKCINFCPDWFLQILRILTFTAMQN